LDGLFLQGLAEQVDAQGPAEAEGAFDAKIDQLPGSLGFGWSEEHGGGEVQQQIDARGDLLAEQFHGGVTCAGGGLPVDVAGVIAGDVSALVLKVDGAASALTEHTAGGAAPLAAAQGQA